jgi:hypothetical protein
VHPQFSDAVARVRAARVCALEVKLLRSRVGAETSAAIFALRNADPTEWRDIKHTEEAYPQNIHKLTDAQLHAIAAQGVRSAIDLAERTRRPKPICLPLPILATPPGRENRERKHASCANTRT